MILLAVDPGVHLGWCIGDTESARTLEREGGARTVARALTHGVEHFSLPRGSSPGVRWIRFAAWLDSRYPDRSGSGLVVYEAAQYAARFSSTAAADMVAGFTTRLEERAARWGWEIHPVAVSSLKKWATGSGRGDKRAIQAALASRFGLHLADDNEADAVGCADWTKVPDSAA